MGAPKGRVPWNRGLSKETDDRVVQYSCKVSLTRRRLFKEGKLRIWNQGKKDVWSEETLEKNRQAHLGKTLSEETKKKIGEALKGQRNPSFKLENREKISRALKGRTLSEEHRKNISKARLAISHKISDITKKSWEDKEIRKRHLQNTVRGKKHHWWKKEKSSEPYGDKWTEALREKVRERDNRTCQLCGKKYKRRKLPVHHIDNDKKNNDLNNLITLCVKCHNKLHGLYRSKISGKTIVYSFMCNDLFHIGHLKHIQKANKMGNYLIIGILTDKAVASYKRNPIISFKERVELTKAIRGVNWVVTQHLRNPLDNLRILKPDILVHGDDWDPSTDEDLKKSKEYIESIGGRLILTPYHQGQNTTMIIEKIEEMKN